VIYTSCNDKLDTKPENKTLGSGIDSAFTNNMILPVIGLHIQVYCFLWEIYITYSVRGDDVNPGKESYTFLTDHRFRYSADDWNLFKLCRMWRAILVPETSNPADLEDISTMSKDSVMHYISDQIDKVLPDLSDMLPNQRFDIPAGLTKYTALTIKALANLELKDYQGVVDVTSQIISSNKFTLYTDFYGICLCQLLKSGTV
jgi:starch-binding outer membrane protein, SusD/RagB family